jgi:hypothetical protein
LIGPGIALIERPILHEPIPVIVVIVGTTGQTQQTKTQDAKQTYSHHFHHSFPPLMLSRYPWQGFEALSGVFMA